MIVAPPSSGPYKGLTPYEERDAAIFFGRDAEREIIAANLAASRLTLLYGPSGVGKSSVLRAGVVSALRRSDTAIAVFAAWRDDPLGSLLATVRTAVADGLPAGQIVPVADATSAMADTLAGWVELLDGELLIVLDQFEEYFLYHPREDGSGTFAVEFPRAINRPDLRVNFLLSIREDALAKLDRFKGRIPNLFANYLRLDYLDRAAARDAVEKPLAHVNAVLSPGEAPVRIETDLVETVLSQVQVGQVVLGQAGAGAVGRRVADDSEMRIDTPYLQVVMTRLWQEEMQAGSRVLRLETLTRLGGAERIVRTHLDDVMGRLSSAEQDTASRVFHHLVTPSGTKIAHAAPDLAEYAGATDSEVSSVMEALAMARIVRSVSPAPGQPTSVRYEIFHDVLAPAILDWQARYRRRWRLRPALTMGVGWGIAGAVVLIGLRMLAERLGLPESMMASRRYIFVQLSFGWPVITGAVLAVAIRSHDSRRQSSGFVAMLTSLFVYSALVYVATRRGPGGYAFVTHREFWGVFMNDVGVLILIGLLTSFSVVTGVVAFQRWLQRVRREVGTRGGLLRSLGVAWRLVALQWLGLVAVGGVVIYGEEIVSGPDVKPPWKPAADALIAPPAFALLGVLNVMIWRTIRSEPARWPLIVMTAGWVLPALAAFLTALWGIGRGHPIDSEQSGRLLFYAFFAQSILGGLVTVWLSWRRARPSATG